jgi:succinate dehydrogenase / fumarate reductase membrane anchor subunit
MSLRTPLSNAKGLGSAREGAHHWWMQRLTSLALLPLTVWLAISIVMFPAMDYASAIAWMQMPITAIAMSLLVISLFYHMQLGLQVIIEDYVGGALKIASLIALNFTCIVMVFIGLYSIIKVSF